MTASASNKRQGYCAHEDGESLRGARVYQGLLIELGECALLPYLMTTILRT